MMKLAQLLCLLVSVQLSHAFAAEDVKDDKIKNKRLLQSISNSSMPIVCRVKGGQEAFVISEPAGYKECERRHGEVSRGSKSDVDKLEVKPPPTTPQNNSMSK